jgi:hypothetical protein
MAIFVKSKSQSFEAPRISSTLFFWVWAAARHSLASEQSGGKWLWVPSKRWTLGVNVCSSQKTMVFPRFDPTPGRFSYHILRDTSERFLQM